MSSTMVFIIIIVAIVTVGRVIRAGLGQPQPKLWQRDASTDDVARLERENRQLHGKIGRLEDRLAVLERIATDAPARLSAQIDELR